MRVLRTAYSDELDLLARVGVVETQLAAWSAERRRPGQRWVRTHARVYPDRSPWAVLVYDADDGSAVQVRLHAGTTARPGSHDEGWLPAGPLGWMQVLPCEADPRLPGLSTVLQRLSAPRVVRYRPGNRCTVRGFTAAGLSFVKVLAELVDDQEEARARWDAATSGALSFAVAEPLGWDESTRSSWYGVVPGVPLRPTLAGPGGVESGRRVGRALGELAASTLRPSRSEDAVHQLTRTRRAVARAAAAAPHLADDLQSAVEALAGAHGNLSPRPLVPVHGAAHLGQWLVDEDGRLGLIDFDRYALGEPEFDLATLLTEVRAESSLRPWAADIEDAVLAGFRAVAGEPDAERMRLYALHKQLCRVARTASGLHPDAAERAARHLRRVRELLTELDG